MPLATEPPQTTFELSAEPEPDEFLRRGRAAFASCEWAVLEQLRRDRVPSGEEVSGEGE